MRGGGLSSVKCRDRVPVEIEEGKEINQRQMTVFTACNTFSHVLTSILVFAAVSDWSAILPYAASND